MNLIEKLIRVDKETVEKKETKKIRSARLTKLLGEETEITIQEVSGRKHNDIMQMMFDEKGKRNAGRNRTAGPDYRRYHYL